MFKTTLSLIEIILTATPLVVQWLKEATSQCGWCDSTPDQGTKIPHSLEQQSPRATAGESVCCNWDLTQLNLKKEKKKRETDNTDKYVHFPPYAFLHCHRPPQDPGCSHGSDSEPLISCSTVCFGWKMLNSEAHFLKLGKTPHTVPTKLPRGKKHFLKHFWKIHNKPKRFTENVKTRTHGHWKC